MDGPNIVAIACYADVVFAGAPRHTHIARTLHNALAVCPLPVYWCCRALYGIVVWVLWCLLYGTSQVLHPHAPILVMHALRTCSSRILIMLLMILAIQAWPAGMMLPCILYALCSYWAHVSCVRDLCVCRYALQAHYTGVSDIRVVRIPCAVLVLCTSYRATTPNALHRNTILSLWPADIAYCIFHVSVLWDAEGVRYTAHALAIDVRIPVSQALHIQRMNAMLSGCNTGSLSTGILVLWHPNSVCMILASARAQAAYTVHAILLTLHALHYILTRTLTRIMLQGLHYMYMGSIVCLVRMGTRSVR